MERATGVLEVRRHGEHYALSEQTLHLLAQRLPQRIYGQNWLRDAQFQNPDAKLDHHDVHRPHGP